MTNPIRAARAEAFEQAIIAVQQAYTPESRAGLMAVRAIRIAAQKDAFVQTAKDRARKPRGVIWGFWRWGRG